MINTTSAPQDARRNLRSKLISNFKHKEYDLQYWIALEKTSTYE